MSTPTRLILAFPHDLLGKLVIRIINELPDVQLVDHIASPADFACVPLPSDTGVALIAADFGNHRHAGLDLLRRLRAESPHTRCVVMFSDITKEETVAAFRLGARGVLSTAACDPYHLCRCITQVNAGQVWANTLQMSWVLDALSAAPPNQSDAVRTISRFGESLLSPRERDIMRLLACGSSNRQIASALDLSEHTVKNYVLRIFEKTGVSSRTELMAQALRRTLQAPSASRLGRQTPTVYGLRVLEKRNPGVGQGHTSAGSTVDDAG